jgi:FdhD protein
MSEDATTENREPRTDNRQLTKTKQFREQTILVQNREVHSSLRITRFDGSRTEADDVVATEEPLEIRVGDKPVSVTLRTPGDDFDLAAGFLFSESILHSRDDVESFRHWGSPNVVRANLREGVLVDLHRLKRHFYSTSSCGVCGKTSIDALRVQTTPIESPMRVNQRVISALPHQLRSRQESFEATGGIHAAGIFTNEGRLLRLREDIGRHNAVDKVLGSLFLEGVDTDQSILMVSGRTSFEIVQKAIVARVPVVAAVGAPSSLAVDLAREFGVTLLGFVRDGRFNVYSHSQRIE